MPQEPRIHAAAIALGHAGLDRPYWLVRPAAEQDRGVPLVLQLHGRGIDPVMFDRWTGFTALAEQAGFALAMPAAVGEIWNDGRSLSPGREDTDDVGYLLAVIDDCCRQLTIDQGRVYVVGMSNGAAMAGRLACTHAERFAAVAQVSGTAAIHVAGGCKPTVPLPILNIHGSADRFAPYGGGSSRGLWARLFLRGRAGPSTGVDDWATLWVAANGCAEEPQVTTAAPDTTIRRWTGDTPTSDVLFYRLDGGGHTWPGMRTWVPPIFGRVSRTIDATRVIWDFFAAHVREP